MAQNCSSPSGLRNKAMDLSRAVICFACSDKSKHPTPKPLNSITNYCMPTGRVLTAALSSYCSAPRSVHGASLTRNRSGNHEAGSGEQDHAAR